MEQSNRKSRHSGEKNNRSLFRRTIALMVCLGILAFAPMVHQLYKLQIVEHDQWEQRAANQQTKSMTVTANRGTIYDRDGRAMALSATVYRLILSPLAVMDSVDKNKYVDDNGHKDKEAYEQALEAKRTLIINGLVDILGLDEETLWKRIQRTKSAYEEVALELEDEEAKAIREFIQENKLANMLYLTPDSKRYYPFSSVAAHVLGYMAENENSGGRKVGAQGIEALYEDALSGKSGRVVTSRNAYGMELPSGYDMYFDAQNGYNLNLTLDQRVQAMAEQTLAEGIETYDVQKGGFCIAMDPSTGAILAMASTPDFDPNSYASILDPGLLSGLEALGQTVGTDSDEYSAQVSAARNKQWRNKALSDTYEPGSTFKPLTVAMALEEGLISLDDHYHCSGVKTVGGWPIRCHKRSGHGDQTLTQAVENSCNVALMEIAEKIGAERFWSYMMDYGLGMTDSTGIDLVGEEGSILWDEETFKGPYGASALATGSFGQTFKVTPIQMITAFASVINGGHLITPYLVQSIQDDNGNNVYNRETEEVRQVISESTSQVVRGILESVVENGSGHNAYMSGYRISGKTGTSEKRDEQDNDDVICSFMGYAPADDPKVLVLLAYDSPKRSAPGSNYTVSGTYISGGNITAPMAGKLIANILDDMGVERRYSSEELTAVDTTMRSVVGQELTAAKSMLEKAGLRCRTIGTGARVTAQVPAAGVSIPGQSTVILYLGDERPGGEVEVPTLKGLSPAAAKSRLEDMGLFMRSAGVSDYTDASVSAVSQSLEAGATVAIGTVVEVHFVSNVMDYDVANKNDYGWER